MAAVRRFLVFGAVLVTVLLLSAHGVQHLPATPNAHAAGPEAFTQALPDTVYEADPSHLGAAQANPALGLNGYCVDVVTENAIPIPNGASGFTVTGGVVLSHSAFTNGSGTAVDDFYCVVVASNVGVTSVGVAWNFTDSVTSIPGSANLTLAVVAVVLEATDGFVDPGPFAQVCTRGWGETILTGAASNLPGSPDPTHQVAAADWTPTPGPPAVQVFGGPFTKGIAPDIEWCVNLTATTEQLNVAVTFDFVSVRNLLSDPDDIPHQVGTTVNILADPGFAELRHITPGGQTLAEQLPAPNIVGATHFACIFPSVTEDRLGPDAIAFTGPAPTGLLVFHDGQNPFFDFTGVADGTLCFGWTSREAGLQRISLTFEKEIAPGVFETRPAFWDTDGDGNESTPGDPALLKEWAEFDRTEITDNPDLAATLLTNSQITNSQITRTLTFNVADGTYLIGGGGSITIFEWALARRPPARWRSARCADYLRLRPVRR